MTFCQNRIVPSAKYTQKIHRKFHGNWCMFEFMKNGDMGLLLATLDPPPLLKGGELEFFRKWVWNL